MIVTGMATIIDVPRCEVRKISQVMRILADNGCLDNLGLIPPPDFSPGVRNLFDSPGNDFNIEVTYIVDKGSDHGVYYIEERPK